MDLVDQVAQQLKTIHLEDDDISEYIVGIVQDDSIEDDEKHEVIGGFLAETTDEPTDSLIDTLLANWKALKQDQEKVELDRKAHQVEKAQALEKERLLKSEKEREELAQQAAEIAAAKQLSKEQKMQRERLRQQYDDVDAVSRTDDLTTNQNAALIQEKERSRREELKKQSEKEKERNKMLLDKQRQQKQDKDAENKKKGPKKERKRM